MNRTIYLSVTFFILLSPIIGFSQAKNINTVTTEEAQILLNDGAILLDLREEADVRKLAFNIEGLINIPLSCRLTKN